MASIQREMIEGYENIARDIQGTDFKNMSIEEILAWLEQTREYCWSMYNSGAEYMGWEKY